MKFLNPDTVLVPTGQYYGKEFFDQHPQVKTIASNTTGNDHIDVSYCKEHGIRVITLENDPIRYELTAVAELTIGLIIALTRNLIPARESVLRGRWNRYPFGGPKMLSRMSAAIIGSDGRIGRMVFERLKSFGIFSWQIDLKYGPGGCFLGLSDIVTVHVPREGNEGLFNKYFFENMKDGSYFINTSRGEIVDEDALLWALESGKLAGAATDVLSGEFAPGFDVKNNKLVQYAQTHSNLIITPHIGGSTKDSWEMTEKRITELCEQ
jgi:phosphoglycerate dehydrogenase-like enzyme